MMQNRTQGKQVKMSGQVAVLIITALFLTFLPIGLVFADEADPPEVNRGMDEFRYPTQEDNKDLTRGMVYMGGLMVLVVVAGTLSVLQLDRKNRPHLLRPRVKHGLPDATVRKEPESVAQASPEKPNTGEENS